MDERNSGFMRSCIMERTPHTHVAQRILLSSHKIHSDNDETNAADGKGTDGP
ncbi:hypothetical protein SETIT_6G015000v2 [Setaria italica]|uniref:Uncharacterized protein n=2 Tax=Setaria TaxID=4554 RepID=A0A368RGW3_SETIT|nr:hypothetical protein SETIT_6G015000v2 [Setaria italica]TKW08201.1 hypothetical protein SEVIR_6G013400v2 [Setaria viridis]